MKPFKFENIMKARELLIAKISHNSNLSANLQLCRLGLQLSITSGTNWRSIFDPPYRLTRPDFVHHFSPRKPVL